MLSIIELTDFKPEHIEELSHLLRQLNPNMPSVCEQTLRRLVESPNCRLLIATIDHKIVGTLTLATYPTLSALRGWIEDVVVDESSRGRGVGRKLVARAKQLAAEMGCQSLSLSSSPHRTAARALYQSEDFEPIQTTLFRLNNH